MSVRGATIAAVLLLAWPEAVAAANCAGTRLGVVVCRPPAAAAAPVRPGRAVRETPAPSVPRLIPAERTDAFGATRVPRPRVTGLRPFGEAPRPDGGAVICRRDAFDAVRCP